MYMYMYIADLTYLFVLLCGVALLFLAALVTHAAHKLLKQTIG